MEDDTCSVSAQQSNLFSGSKKKIWVDPLQRFAPCFPFFIFYFYSSWARASRRCRRRWAFAWRSGTSLGSRAARLFLFRFRFRSSTALTERGRGGRQETGRVGDQVGFSGRRAGTKGIGRFSLRRELQFGGHSWTEHNEGKRPESKAPQMGLWPRLLSKIFYKICMNSSIFVCI